MCVACFNHLLADAKLKDEQVDIQLFCLMGLLVVQHAKDDVFRQ